MALELVPVELFFDAVTRHGANGQGSLYWNAIGAVIDCLVGQVTGAIG